MKILKNLLILLVLVTFSSFQVSGLLNNSLIHVWTFNSTDYTDSISNWDLTSNVGSATRVGVNPEGVLVKHYNTNDARGTGVQKDMPTNLGISAWVYDADLSGYHNQYLYYLGDGATNRDHINMVAGGSSSQISANTAGGGCTATNTELNKWYHIFVQFQSSGTKIYIDGSLNKTCSFTKGTGAGTSGICFGDDGNGGSGCGNTGLPDNHALDEVYFYDRILNTSEITILASNATEGFFPFVSTEVFPPVTSNYNYTFNNIIGNGNTGLWNNGTELELNVSSPNTALTWTADVNSNFTAILNQKGNYSEILSICPSCKATTTGALLHSITLIENLSKGNNFICLSGINTDALLEEGSGNCTAILNITRKQINTTQAHLDFDVSEVILSSTTDILISNFSFNQSEIKRLIFKGSGNAISEGTLKGTISASLVFNGVVLFNESIVTVNKFQSNVFSFPIIGVNSIVGSNNLLLYYKTSNGMQNMTDIEIHVDTNTSEDGSSLGHSHQIFSPTFSSTTYTRIANLSITSLFNSTKLIDITHKMSASSNNILVSCYIVNNVTGERTPTYSRFLKSSADTGSSGIKYMTTIPTKGTERWDIFCKDAASTITNNITFHMLDFIDEKDKKIITLGNTTEIIQTITGNNNKIVQFNNYIVQNSSEVEMAFSIYYKSTSGAQQSSNTPVVFLNNSNILNNCFNRVQRSLSGNTDVVSINVYHSCENLSIGTKYNFSVFVNVAAGETINILNTSLVGYEVTETNIFQGNVPPIPVIVSPTNNSNLSYPFTMDFIISDPNNNGLNGTVFLNNTILVSGLYGLNTSFTITSGTLGLQNLTLQVCENDTVDLLCVNDTIKILMDVGPKVKLTFPNQNQQINTTFNITINCSATDNNNLLNISLYITNNANTTFRINQTINTTDQNKSALFNVTTTIGNYTWNCQACDSSKICLFNETNRTFGISPGCFSEVLQSVNISYAVNYSILNWSNIITPTTVVSGNYSWNFTEFNISATNITKGLYKINNTCGSTQTLQLKQNTTRPEYFWKCININITNNFKDLITLNHSQMTYFNCTLDVINISQTYVNWTLTVNKAIWDIKPDFKIK